MLTPWWQTRVASRVLKRCGRRRRRSTSTPLASMWPSIGRYMVMKTLLMMMTGWRAAAMVRFDLVEKSEQPRFLTLTASTRASRKLDHSY